MIKREARRYEFTTRTAADRCATKLFSRYPIVEKIKAGDIWIVTAYRIMREQIDSQFEMPFTEKS